VNAAQVAAVVAKIRLGDNRETSREVILEWVDSIGDLDFDDAVEAVRMHRRETTVYLQPAHVRANVRLLRARRERDVRVSQPIVAAMPITLDRAEFDRLTAVAIAEHRAGKAMRS